MPLHLLFCHSAPSGGALRRTGTLAARGWRLRLYALALEAGGLQPEDLAVAERAFRAGIAATVPASTAGFGLLRPGCEAGSLALSACWWEGSVLHRAALLLAGTVRSPRRDGMVAGQVGDVDGILLMGREAASWRRCVLEAGAASLDHYMAECCA